MGYLEDFEKAINHHDAPKLLRLWEEYTSSDEVDEEDLKASLEAIKASELRDYVGRHIERALPLWEKVTDPELKDEVLRLINDLQVTNTDTLRQLTVNYLHKNFGNQPDFGKKMRLIGLHTNKGSFRGAISQYLLLNHMKKGNFVFHSAGWGVGEIMDVSMIREQLGCEFDYVPGKKDIPFKIAFTTLIPIPKTHFLARRFGDPDTLEEEAKKDPVEVIKMLLKDLGPKTATEIKDELCELVIPEAEWNRWWQGTRSKIKKNTQIESPKDIKKPFKLRKSELSHEKRLQQALEEKLDPSTLIHTVYTYLKDFSDTLKDTEFRESLIAKMKELVSFQEVSEAQGLQIHFLLQDLTGEKDYPPIKELLKGADSIGQLISEIPIQAFKKRTLMQVRKCRDDWEKLLLDSLFAVEQNPLRDYLLGEILDSTAKKTFEERITDLCGAPQQFPEVVIWYYQKVMGDPKLPLGSPKGRSRLFEALLILLSHLEKMGNRRDLIKKIHALLLGRRYANVRAVMKDATVSDVKEFLLLVSKCQSLTDHDKKIFLALAEVAHPSLKKERKGNKEEEEDHSIWTTQEGYTKLQKRIEQIGTVETVENAKEIEVARSHGDLRENAEFKAALERRDRLQAELKFLSDQLNNSRILTPADIDTSKVSIGTIITCETSDGKTVSYTLLGPWDANPDEHILSFQSKLAQNMLGLSRGDTFELQGKKLTIKTIRSAL